MFFNKGTNQYQYRETTYQFPDGTKYKTRIFLEALTESKYREIDKIILVGTKTSNWGELVFEKDYEEEGVFDLYGRLYEGDKNKTGIAGADKGLLECYLTKHFAVPVKLCISEALIDDCTAQELFTLYSSLKSDISAKSDILFDITHSFRSIPLLVYQALQFTFGGTDSRRQVELVYGEFVNEKQISYVRNLSKYWEFAQIADALSVFTAKLDGSRLAQFVETVWHQGAKALVRLTEIVQTNFALQVIEVIRQINNAITEYPTDAPTWLGSVRDALSEICKLLDVTSVSKTLYKYSCYLYAHQLNVQAVITLQVAVEACIVEKYGNIQDNLGDYDWWQSNGKNYLHKLRNNAWQKLGIPLTNLERFRNQVAHGGGKNRNGSYPQAANIPNIYESGKRGIERLFAELAQA